MGHTPRTSPAKHSLIFFWQTSLCRKLLRCRPALRTSLSDQGLAVNKGTPSATTRCLLKATNDTCLLVSFWRWLLTIHGPVVQQVHAKRSHVLMLRKTG